MTTISSMTKGFDANRLLPPNEALERYFACVTLPAPQTERVSLDAARTRVLASEIVADGAYPSAARSSMDGFAVRAGSQSRTFRIVGDVAIATVPTRGIGDGEAMRIPTGGVLPEGADAVVPVEDATLNGEKIVVSSHVAAGNAVVQRGSDMRAGESILSAGRRIGSPELAVLATLGVVDVPVYRRPLVAVISSGDELVAPSEPLPVGRVRDSNRYAVAASLEALGARVRHLPIVRDVAEALEHALREALDECDAAVISGGSSVGAHDFTPIAVASLGSPGVVVHGLRVRPGKPTMLAAIGTKPVVGLPGNPLSSLMMLEGVAVGIFERLTGAPAAREETAAMLSEPIDVPVAWTWFAPVTLSGSSATPVPMRSSSTSAAARASGYVVADAPLAAGSAVCVRRFLCGGLR